MNSLGFYKITLPLERDLFNELFNSIDFEDIAKGRIGNHLVNIGDDGIPIVRTTTKYNIPAHNFSAIHHMLIEEINSTIQTNYIDNHFPAMHFNNALIEIYDRDYTKMGYHSDQCLDLDPRSYIGLFSCYERPDELSEQFLRKLKIKDKTTQEEFEIPLTHNSVILFSLQTNAKFLHKIVLESSTNQKILEPDNKWLGITFRKSKTFIHFKDGLPYFSNGELLALADDNQQTAFYKIRGQENNDMDFNYPTIAYTLSVGDTIIPKDFYR
ncbi:alpha-ketoglutarate-dependent dioxygenase AlkB [Arcicella aquatica]|uniref:Alpha-ketoglutarate-dependent dioxygenase AlkB n=1 Tax=Arcicella aquatica TaxID=217141 RepID=A0ABU5QRV7_9BACT|nr:alpha-ketoglutarate-dependent dioxygenase AlkB [Arcicella aquatica]MEA5259822.1 alpha-ketoglutarate-dependent dioxygenase AlkB [Arcicella aquatica]